jgi:hypothetical protein
MFLETEVLLIADINKSNILKSPKKVGPAFMAAYFFKDRS